MNTKILLHKIILPDSTVSKEVPELIFRGITPKWDSRHKGFSIDDGECDFSTYFNSFSLSKWTRYTIADSFFLELKMRGSFFVDLYGYNTGEKKIFKRLISSDEFHLKRKATIKIDIPKGDFNITAFAIRPIKDTVIYEGGYYAEVEKGFVREPLIKIITTTYKKEDYVRKNADKLREMVFDNECLGPAFSWLIVDNGGSKELEELENEQIKVVHNPNTGGSGGFARGMIEVCHLQEKPTHIILTDDDIEFIPGSFERVYSLLSILKDEFKDNFIAGAMLREDKPYLQIEDVGHMMSNGFLGGIKPPKDMRFLSRVISNEENIPYVSTQYSAWWFCCMPTGTVSSDNLPLPLFVRDDDVDYSVRNHVGVMTMNGIGVRHERFYDRFSGVNEYYLGLRNELIVSSIHDEFAGFDIFYLAKDVLKRELYKYNYKSAEIVMRAIEDFLKGPEFLKNTPPISLLAQIKKMDNEILPLTPRIKNLTGFKKLKKRYDLSKLRKFIYDYTYNGQKFISFIPVKRPGVIERGWKYCVEKQYLTKEVYSVDKKAGTYCLYKKDTAKFKDIMNRFAKLEARFMSEKDKVIADYRAAVKELSSEEFWNGYFKRAEEDT